jgi:hypothetical protein
MNLGADVSKIAVLGALFAVLALPAQALAEYYVPPGNSAANQYTESFPSAGGESAGKRGGAAATPGMALGAANAHRLQAQGRTGRAAAEVAAETAPTSRVVATDGADRINGGSGGHDGADVSGEQAQGSVGSGQEATAHGNSLAGSSGLGQVVAQATGASDDGSLGLWLPLAILGAIAGSIAYRLRSSRGPTA